MNIYIHQLTYILKGIQLLMSYERARSLFFVNVCAVKWSLNIFCPLLT